MKYAVLQYDNRHNNNLEKLMLKNKNICDNLDIFEYIKPNIDNSISQYWIKVKLTNKLISDDKYDGVLWLDSDAIIHNSQKLIKLINSTPLFLMSGDNPLSEFCAGVWFVRNNNTGKLLIKQWIQLYYNKYYKFWHKDDKTNLFQTNMPFAIHPCYEQPAFIKHMLPNYNITKVPWYVLNNPFIPLFDNSATLHFYGCFKNTIPIYLHLNSYF